MRPDHHVGEQIIWNMMPLSCTLTTVAIMLYLDRLLQNFCHFVEEKYKIFIHSHDLEPGSSVVGMLANVIHSSNRTLIIINKDRKILHKINFVFHHAVELSLNSERHHRVSLYCGPT